MTCLVFTLLSCACAVEYIYTPSDPPPGVLPSDATHITIDGVSLPVLSAHALSHLTRLVSLRLRNTGRIRIEDSALSGLSELRELEVTSGGLEELHPGMFSGAGPITRLILDNNNIESLKEGVLDPLESLEELSINNNGLRVIQDDVFVTSLIRISLASNRIQSLDPFRNLPRLEHLDLSGNLISGLPPPGVLSGLPSLQTLDLSRNSLTSLPAGGLGGLASLRVLDLSANALTLLEPLSLGGLPDLRTLSLSDNRLQHVTFGVFDPVVYAATRGLPGE